MRAILHPLNANINHLYHIACNLSRGDLTEKIINDYSETFGQLKDDANATVDKLQEIVNIIKNATNQ